MLAPDIQSQLADLLNRLVLVDGETAVGQLSLRHFLFLDVLLVEVPETEPYPIIHNIQITFVFGNDKGEKTLSPQRPLSGLSWDSSM